MESECVLSRVCFLSLILVFVDEIRSAALCHSPLYEYCVCSGLAIFLSAAWRSGRRVFFVTGSAEPGTEFVQ